MIPERQRTIGAIALLVLVAVVALSQSWSRWLEPIIDTGRDLYVAEQVANGSKLYRDLRYQYPPLTPYLLAGFHRVAGSSLAIFTWFGIAQSALVAWLLWLAVPRWGGVAAALMFLALSFTGASTWGANFIFPYAYAATLGIALLLAALVCFLGDRHAIAVALLVAASWCKLEYAIAAAFVIAVLAVARRLRWTHAVAYAVAMVITTAMAVLVFGPALRDNVLFTSLTEGDIARRFFNNVAGVVEWQRNLLVALVAAIAIAAIAWLMQRRPALGAAAAIVAALVFTSETFFRGWGALQFVALLAGFRNRQSPLLYFAAFSIATTLRVPLNTTPEWYGFALTVPMYALAAHVLFVELPSRGIDARWWFAVIAAISVRDVWHQREMYALKTHAIVTPRGTFYDVNPDRARVLTELIASVSGPTLAVMPEGASINYFTGRRSPLTFYMFTPPETASFAVEQAVVAEMRQSPPDEVVIVSRNVAEYGSRGFGVDYNTQIAAQITENYSVKREWREPRFQAALLERKR